MLLNTEKQVIDFLVSQIKDTDFTCEVLKTNEAISEIERLLTEEYLIEVVVNWYDGLHEGLVQPDADPSTTITWMDVEGCGYGWLALTEDKAENNKVLQNLVRKVIAEDLSINTVVSRVKYNKKTNIDYMGYVNEMITFIFPTRIEKKKDTIITFYK